MISGISSANSMPPPPPPSDSGAQSLTEEQETSLTELLSDYDSSDLSDADAKDIVSEIKELGIEPGKGLADALASAGFDAQAIAEQAGIGAPQSAQSGTNEGPPPPPPSGSEGSPEAMVGEINSEAISALKTLIEGYEGEDLSSDDWANVFTDLEEQGFDMAQGLVDVKI